jgi:hypothetical protein
MPVNVQEKFESRQSTSGDNSQAELAYIISGTDDDIVAKNSLAGAAPALHDGLVRLALQIEPVGPGMWDGTVRYGKAENQQSQAGESSFSFDTGGGSQHITQSIATVNKYTASGTAPDFKGAIGVTSDNVEGVDITVPVYNFFETHYIAPADVDDLYKGVIFNLTGKVNNAPFRGLAAGECLFLGASGSRRGRGADDPWEITYRFAGSPNRTNLSIGGISGIAKKGWEYLWVRYQDAVDYVSNNLVKQPLAVYIEKVYEEGDFSTLGI